MLLGAAPFAAGRPAIASDTPCTPVKKPATNWHDVQAVGLTIQIPKGFALTTAHASSSLFNSGQRTIGIGRNMGSAMIATGGTLSLVTECHAIIADRPVLISVYSVFYEDAPMAPTGEAGTKYLAIAEFPATAHTSAISVWLFSPYRSDAVQLRQIFWSARFPSSAVASADTTHSEGAGSGSAARPAPAAPCVRATPLPVAALDAVVDTGLVGSLAASSGELAAGHTTIVLQFDSTGTLAGAGTVESDLPESTQRTVNSLLTSNVRQRPAGHAATVLLRVETSAKGLSYVVEPSVNCPD